MKKSHVIKAVKLPEIIKILDRGGIKLDKADKLGFRDILKMNAAKAKRAFIKIMNSDNRFSFDDQGKTYVTYTDDKSEIGITLDLEKGKPSINFSGLV